MIIYTTNYGNGYYGNKRSVYSIKSQMFHDVKTNICMKNMINESHMTDI